MHGRHTYLVERYMPGPRRGDIERIGSRLAGATKQMRCEGRRVSWVRSLGLPDDDTCLCIFTADTMDDVEEANRRGGVDYERIVETVTIARETVDKRPLNARGR